LIIVAATLIQAPPSTAHTTPQFAAWLALGAAVAITVGGLLLKSRVSVVITRRPRDRTATVPPDHDEYPAEDYPEDDYRADELTETRPLADEEHS
jgi:hypothetical protein